MIVKNRAFVLVAALVAALVMLLALSSAGFASGNTPSTATACVDGYVINHRELVVDGVKAGLVVKAVDASGAEFPTSAPVGSDGYFKFEKLPVGDWDFQLQLPQDWEGIVPAADRGMMAKTGLTPIVESKNCHRIVFKIRRVYEVVIIKWEELLDGKVRPGSGWVITATPVNDPFVKAQTDTTDENGEAGFTLTAGKWVISEKVKAGWQPITPQSVTLDLDQYGPGGAMDRVVFKNREPACYATIIVEKRGHGTDLQGVEVPLGPLAGWKVTVSRADGGMAPVTKMTDASGKATFTHLTPGVYKITEQVQVGWEAVSDNPQTKVIMNCETVPVTFDNKEIKGDMRIYGKKLFKAWVAPYKGELVGLSGWKITATLVGDDTYTATTYTNALGDYLFSEADLVAAGIAFPGASVDVCEEDRDNWIHVTPKCVRVKFPYPLPPDFMGAKADFTNIQDPPAATVNPAGSCQAYHMIARGETLAQISGRYGVSMTALAQVNRIRNLDKIFAGQKLCVSW